MANSKAGFAVSKTQKANTKWLKNAMKSVGLIGKSTLKEMAPTITDIAESGVNTSRNLASSIRKNKSGVNKVSDAINQNKYVKLLGKAFDNALTDIKAGNFAGNDERMFSDSPEDEIKELESGFSFGDDGAESAPNINYINASNNDAVMNLSQQLEKNTIAQVKTSKASMDAYIAVSSASMQQTGEHHAEIMSQLTNVNSNLAALVQYNNENMTKFIEASMAYFEKTGSAIDESSSSTSSKNPIEDVLNGGKGFNLSSYKEYVKKQFKNSEVYSTLGLAKEFLSDDMLKQLASNPLSFIPALGPVLMNKMLPSLGNAITEMESAVASYVPTFLSQLGEMANSTDSGLFGSIKRGVGNIFGLRGKRDTSMGQRGEIEYGAIPFDGETKVAITEIITKELREQTSYMKVLSEHFVGNKVHAQAKSKEEYFLNGEWVQGIDSITERITDKLAEAFSVFDTSEFGKRMHADLTSSFQADTKYQNASDDDKIKILEENEKMAQDALNVLWARIERGVNDGAITPELLMSYINELKTGDNPLPSNITDLITKAAENMKEDNMLRSSLNGAKFMASSRSNKIKSEIQENYARNQVGNSKYANLTGEELDRMTDAQLRAKLTGTDAQNTNIQFAGSESGQKEHSKAYEAFDNAASHASSMLQKVIHGDSAGALKEIGSAFIDQTKIIGSGIIKTLFGEKGEDPEKSKALFPNVRTMFEGGIEGMKQNFSKISESVKSGVKDLLFGKKADENDPESGSKGILGSIGSVFKSGLDGWMDSFFGTNDEKEREKQKKSIVEGFKDVLPSALTGSAIGAGVGLLSSGSVLGMLVGGPIGGALIGTAGGILAKSDSFQNWLFGSKNEDGSREDNGFISKRIQDFAKENKGKLVGGATIGSIAGGMTGAGVLGTLVGGPIAGAMLGVGASILSQSDVFKTWLLGDKENGKDGIFQKISKSFKKGRGEVTGEAGGDKKTLDMALLGGGGGALSAAMIGKMGILGASLTPLGPIGGAIGGLALGIKASHGTFKEWLFGTEDTDEKQGKVGVLGQFKNMLKANIIRPLSTEFKYIGREIMNTLENGILAPFTAIAESVSEHVGGLVKKVADGVGGMFKGLGKSIIAPFAKVANSVTRVFGNVAAGIVKKTGDAVNRLVTAPVDLFKAIVDAFEIKKKIGNFFGKLFSPVKKVLLTTKTIIMDGIVKPITDAAKTAIKGIFGAFGKIISAPFKLIKSGVSKLIGMRESRTGEKSKLRTVMDNYRARRMAEDAPPEDGEEDNRTLQQKLRYSKAKRKQTRAENKDKRQVERWHDKNAKLIHDITKGRYSEDTEEARAYVAKYYPAQYEKLKEKGNFDQIAELEKRWKKPDETEESEDAKVQTVDEIRKGNDDKLDNEGKQTSFIIKIHDLLEKIVKKDKNDSSEENSEDSESNEDSSAGFPDFFGGGKSSNEEESSSEDTETEGGGAGPSDTPKHSKQWEKDAKEADEKEKKHAMEMAQHAADSKAKALDQAKTVEEVKKEKAAEKEGKTQLNILDKLKDIGTHTKDVGKTTASFFSGWSSIFSKKGLITAGLLMLAPTIIKNLPSIFGVLKDVGTWFVNKGKGLISDIATTVGNIVSAIGGFFDTGYDSDRTNGNNGIEEGKRIIDEVKNGDVFTDADGNAVSRTDSMVRGAAHLSYKGYNKVAGAYRRVSGAVEKVKSGAKKTKNVFNKGKDFVKKHFLKNGAEEVGEEVLEKGAAELAEEGAEVAAKEVAGEAAEKGAAELAEKGLEAGSKKAAQAAEASAAKYVAGKIAEEGAEETLQAAATKGAELAVDNSLKTLGSKVKEVIKKFISFLQGKFASDVGTKITAAETKVLEEALTEAAEKPSILGKISAKLETAFAKDTVFLVKIGFTALAGLNGLTAAAKLFHVDGKYVDWKMKLISSAMAAISEFFTVMGVIDILVNFVSSMMGIDLMSEFAVLVYNLLSSEEDKKALENARLEFQNEYEQYKESAYTDAWHAALKAGEIPDTVTLEEFEKNYSKYEPQITKKAEYKSEMDYNTEQHKSAVDRVVQLGGKVFKGVKKGFKAASNRQKQDAEMASKGMLRDPFTGKYHAVAGGSGKGHFNKGPLTGKYRRDQSDEGKNDDPLKMLSKSLSNSLTSQLNSILKTNGNFEEYISTLSQYSDPSKSWNQFVSSKMSSSKKGEVSGMMESIIKGMMAPLIMVNRASSSISKAISGISSSDWDVSDSTSSPLSTIRNGLQTAANNFGSRVSNVVSTAGSYIRSGLSTVGNAVSSGWNWLKKKVTANPVSTNSAGVYYAGGHGGFGADSLNGGTYYAQNDERWGDNEYNLGYDDATMADTGCGPTAAAMAMSDVTGTSISPTSMASLAKVTGDRDDTGTNWNFMNKAASAYGQDSTQTINPSSIDIAEGLSSGNPMILSGTSNDSGPYTSVGHYIVAEGIDNNGNVQVNDPRGPEYSRSIDIDDLASQTGSSWSFGGYGKRRKSTNRVIKKPYINRTMVLGGKGTISRDQWLVVVKKVKQAIAEKKPGYHQDKTINITIDGVKKNVRPDCSGFVSACMAYSGLGDAKYCSSDFTSGKMEKLKAAGFRKTSWPGWNSLEEGDIIALNGHVEIFCRVDGDTHYVYNCGSDSSVNNPNATKSSHNSYTTVWKPQGTASSSSSDATVESTGETTTGTSQPQAKGLSYITEMMSAIGSDLLSGDTSLSSVKALQAQYNGTTTDASTDASGTTTVANGNTTQFPTYNLSDREKQIIANVITGETGGGNLFVSAQEASQMANLNESKNRSHDDEGMKKTVKKHSQGGWYADKSFTKTGTKYAKRAVEEVLVQGKRTLPRWIDEHDWFPNDIRNPKDRSKYKVGDTVNNKYGSTYRFYTFFGKDKKGDIAGGHEGLYKKYKNDVPFSVNSNDQIVAGGSGRGPSKQRTVIKSNTQKANISQNNYTSKDNTFKFTSGGKGADDNKKVTEFLLKLAEINDFIQSHQKKFTYKWANSTWSSVKSRVNKGQRVTMTCVSCVNWALGEVLNKSSSPLRVDGGGNFRNFKGEMTKYLKKITSGDPAIGKTCKQAIDKGLLKPGDIIGFKNYEHIFTYSGNGYNMYDSGRASGNNGNYPHGIYTSYKHNKRKIGAILRWKDGISGSATVSKSGTNATSTTDQGTVSTNGANSGVFGFVGDFLAASINDSLNGTSTRKDIMKNIDSYRDNSAGGSGTGIAKSTYSGKTISTPRGGRGSSLYADLQSISNIGSTDNVLSSVNKKSSESELIYAAVKVLVDIAKTAKSSDGKLDALENLSNVGNVVNNYYSSGGSTTQLINPANSNVPSSSQKRKDEIAYKIASGGN